MGLGDILGSISPAYGLITGQGLGGMARNLNPIYLLLHHFGGGGSSQPTMPKPDLAAPMAVNTGMSGPATSLPNTIGSAAASLPGMAKPSIAGSLGAALQSSGSQDQGIVYPPQLAPQSNGLGAILAQLLGGM